MDSLRAAYKYVLSVTEPGFWKCGSVMVNVGLQEVGELYIPIAVISSPSEVEFGAF